MKTGLISGLALGACASVALAEPATVADAKDATAEAHAAGPITLTEAEMDKVTAGYGRTSYLRFLPRDNKSAGEALDAITEIISEEVSKGAGFVQR